MAINNQVRNIRSQCQVVVYRWRTGILTSGGIDTGRLSEAKRTDVSSRIMTANFSKNIGSAAGQFSFTLANNTGTTIPDWRQLIRVGHWCVIYMSQDGDLDISEGLPVTSPKTKPPNNKIRCIGYIERVAARTMVNERGAFDTMIEVSGRDFGIVYENTTMWMNLFQFDSIALEAAAGRLNIIGNTPLEEQMQIMHDLFYAPQKLLPTLTDDSSSVTSIARQWLIPRILATDLGIKPARGLASFWGNLDNVTNFEKSAMSVPVDNPVSAISGNVWGKLKGMSVPAFHELFCETTLEGQPKLNFRPIPWQIDGSRYPSVRRFIREFGKNRRVLVNAVDVMALDIGLDNQNRKNHFLATIKTTLFNAEDNITNVQGSGFPREIVDSVRRHGFQPMHVDINSLTLNAALGDGKTNKSLLKDFNEVIYDYWVNAIFYDSGNVEMIGSNEVKVGDCMQFAADVPYTGDRLFYIEGYTDTFVVGENGTGDWMQSVQLTRGIDLVDLRGGGGKPGVRDVFFDQEGEYTGDFG